MRFFYGMNKLIVNLSLIVSIDTFICVFRLGGYCRNSCSGDYEYDSRELRDGKCGHVSTKYAYNTERKCKSGCACETCVEAGTVQGEGNSTAAAQSDANNKAQQRANAMTCNTQYRSVQKSGSATRNNCGSGCTGSSVTYTVEAGKYTSCVSQADADNQAQTDVNNNKQSYANSHGECTCPASCRIDGTVSIEGDTSTRARLTLNCTNVSVSNCNTTGHRVILTLTGASIEQGISWGEKLSSNRQVIFDVYNTGYIIQGAQINLDSGVSYDAVFAEVNYYDKINGTCPDCTVNWHN